MCKSKFLSLELVQQHPVWTFDESNDFVEPVYDYDPLPFDKTMPLFVRARIVTHGGLSIQGGIWRDVRVYAVEIFVDAAGCAISKNTSDDLFDAALLGICGALRIPKDEFFPLAYQTQAGLTKATELQGVLDWGR